MRCNGVVRSIVFAAAAASLAPLCWHLLGIPTHVHAFGACAGHAWGPTRTSALAWVWIGLVAAYAHGIAPGRGPSRSRRALGAALGLASAGAAAHWLGFAPIGVLATGAIGLSVARISWSPAALGIRRLALEAALCLGSLAFSVWLMQVFAYGPLAFAAGVWGFFLVQGLWFATAASARPDDLAGDAFEDAGDVFEAAQRRLESLLTEAGP